MTKTFTHNEIMDLIAQEPINIHANISSVKHSQAIIDYTEFDKTIKKIKKIRFSPSQKSIDNILQYANRLI